MGGQEPWLAALPDGVCYEGDAVAGLLEVKTARCWTEDVAARLHDAMPCDWLYQMQGGLQVASMALGTKLGWCDLFLWSPQDYGCRRIAFDAEFWERQMFPSLRSFYFHTFLPRMV